MKIGTRKEAFKHILSFRRQVYIINNEDITIPESITVIFEENMYRLFLTEDNIRCTICQKRGHTENQCHHIDIQHNETITQPNNIENQLRETNEPTTITQSQSMCETSYLSQASFISNIEESQLLNLMTTEEQKDEQKNNEKQQKLTAISQQIEENTEKQYNKPIQQSTQSTIEQLSQQLKELEKKSQMLTQQLNEQQSKENQTLQTSEQQQIKMIKTSDATTVENKTSPTTSATAKRPAMDSNSSEENQETPKKVNGQKKKQRSLSPKDNLEDQLKNIKIEIEQNPNKYAVNYEILKDFLENSQGHKDHKTLAGEYAIDIQGLVTTLQDLYSLLEDSKLKNRFTRLINKLNN